MTDEDLIELVNRIAAKDGMGGLEVGTLYGDFALEVAKAVLEEASKDYAILMEKHNNLHMTAYRLKSHRERLRAAARSAVMALRAEGTKYGRLCEMLNDALSEEAAKTT